MRHLNSSSAQVEFFRFEQAMGSSSEPSTQSFSPSQKNDNAIHSLLAQVNCLKEHGIRFEIDSVVRSLPFTNRLVVHNTNTKTALMVAINMVTENIQSSCEILSFNGTSIYTPIQIKLVSQLREFPYANFNNPFIILV